VDPVFGWVVVELQQHIQIIGDLRHGFRELLAVVVLERRRGFAGVLEVFGVVEGGLGACVGWFRQRGEHVRHLVKP
jgi:hypothetical protein